MNWGVLLLIVLAIAAVYFISQQATPDAPPADGGSGGTVSGDDQRLAKAMCADLSDGFSMFQMHSQAVEHYRDLGRSGDAAQLAAAKLEDLATREYCPEFRDDFESTIVYEEWIES